MPPDRHHEMVKKLIAQLTSRRQKVHSSGVLWMESKPEMAARGVKSPDVADAFAIAFGVIGVLSWSYLPYDDTGRQEIARVHGWEYTTESDDEAPRSWGYTEHPTKDELKGGGSSVGGESLFGDVHFHWAMNRGWDRSK